MKIEYDQNPLNARVVLNERDRLLLRKSIELETIEEYLYQLTPEKYQEILDKTEKEVERILPYYLSALDGEIHCGDCTKACCPCIKCHAEDFACVNTLEGIRNPYYVNKAFSAGRKTLDEAIQYLKDNPAKATWEGSEPYVTRWQLAQDQAIEDLIEYKRRHFNEP